jgi:DNA processing protein
MTRPLGATERLAWLQLARTPGVGALTFHRLLARAGDALSALEDLGRLSKGRLRPISKDIAARELEALEAFGAQLICSCEGAYPRNLAALDPGPPVIAACGDLRVLSRPQVALVGGRDASAAGLKLAGDLARELGAAGFTIVSGMARGIDARAHAASLATGTVAVLAGGLDKPYPPQNLALFEELRERGLVISEAPMGLVARAQDFPRRNHIISGISLGVVVVEAAERSGSLITARAAGEQGREVMAAPGSPLDPRARGANRLIKQGATLVENADDVIAVLAPLLEGPRAFVTRARAIETHPDPADDGLTARLAQALSPTPVHINELARVLNTSSQDIAAALVELEMTGEAASLAGGYAVSAQGGAA